MEGISRDGAIGFKLLKLFNSPHPQMQAKLKTQIYAVFIAGASLSCNTDALANTCYDIAVQRFNRARATLQAPYNSAQAIYAGRPPVDCTIDSLYLSEYSLRISCADGYKYEIGTTEYCVRGGEPNCEKAIVTTPNGQKTYHAAVPLGDEKSCTTEGAQLTVSNKIFLDNNDVVIISTHQFGSKPWRP